MKFKLLLLTVCTVLSFVAFANHQPQSNQCRKTDIAGGVIQAQTKKPLGNVTVTAYVSDKKEKVAFTDNNGNYSFNELRPGTYKFVFEKDGFKKLTKEKITIRPEGGCQLNVEMRHEKGFEIMPGQLIFTEF